MRGGAAEGFFSLRGFYNSEALAGRSSKGSPGNLHEQGVGAAEGAD
ncbi:hypothetical protein M3223_14935 [Paenibacillus pasadenensis]|nr:hypothetical protein [Paenibacillus pasadenensis]